MNVLVISCNHHKAGVQLRERLAFSNSELLNNAYSQWREIHPDSELVVLSTCNRVEIYAADEREDDGVSFDDITRFISRFHNVPTDEFVHSVLAQSGTAAVEHLFEVACSIDSMVLGEPQIVNQVKEAYRVAQENAACGPLTNVLFQHALKVSAQVRTETGLADGRVSIASVAVGDFGKSIFSRFDNKTVLVIGAGEMAEETLTYLQSEGVKRIVVANRNRERAERLAAKFKGEAVDFSTLDEWLAKADVIVSTTGASQTLITKERFAAARARSQRHPVFILDLAAPRDFDPAAGTVDDNVFLYDLDALEETCSRNRAAREAEVEKARGIIAAQTKTFMQEIYHRATGPVIHRLREHWTDISRSELDRLYRKLPTLESAQRQAIEATIQRIVNKLLHPPLEALKDEAKEGTPEGLLHAIRRLFFFRSE
ncbi:MAG: glutamyl-tRNA reductase [Planctomycetota bacterium]|nr:MAG: glutamyl-tRNA reductase [Planctomycetota bacterium]